MIYFPICASCAMFVIAISIHGHSFQSNCLLFYEMYVLRRGRFAPRRTCRALSSRGRAAHGHAFGHHVCIVVLVRTIFILSFSCTHFRVSARFNACYRHVASRRLIRCRAPLALRARALHGAVRRHACCESPPRVRSASRAAAMRAVGTDARRSYRQV
jgi:hypothetical protein